MLVTQWVGRATIHVHSSSYMGCLTGHTLFCRHTLTCELCVNLQGCRCISLSVDPLNFFQSYDEIVITYKSFNQFHDSFVIAHTYTHIQTNTHKHTHTHTHIYTHVNHSLTRMCACTQNYRAGFA